MNYRKSIYELISPFDVIARVRNAVTRRAMKLNISAVSALIILDDAENQLYTDYACTCGATIFNCECDNDYRKHTHFGQYTPNTLHQRYN